MRPANFNQPFQETPPKPKRFVVSDSVSFPICVCSQLKEIFVVCVTYSFNSTISRVVFFFLTLLMSLLKDNRISTETPLLSQACRLEVHDERQKRRRGGRTREGGGREADGGGKPMARLRWLRREDLPVELAPQGGRRGQGCVNGMGDRWRQSNCYKEETDWPV